MKLDAGNARVYNPMKLSLVFENSGDTIELDVVYNHDLIKFFVEKANSQDTNSFYNNRRLFKDVDTKLNDINWCLSKTNEVYYALANQTFAQHNNLLDYLNQKNLNHQHERWVKSQLSIVDIDELRFSSDPKKSQLGYILHDQYPDDIRKIKLAEAMIKLGYIYPYEEVNLTVHRLENIFHNDHEFSAKQKWEVFANPFVDSMISNNDKVNFSFGYTYVGRQYHNKWLYWDTDLEYTDHYNYETLEWSFQLNLGRPQTIPFSPEFINWAKSKNVKPTTTQIPIANVVDLETNLTYYRTILYKNSRDNNPTKLFIT